MSSGKAQTAINRVIALFNEWDNGSKFVRLKILNEFLQQNGKSVITGPELEMEFAQAASLFLARITAWLRLTYMDGTCLNKQLKAISVFLQASSGHRFLTEFLEVGGILTSLEVLGLDSAGDADRLEALKILMIIAKCGRKYKELICESYGIKSIAECLARSIQESVQEQARLLLQELGQGNPRYEQQVYKGLIALLPSTSPKAQQMAAQTLRFIQPIVKKAHPNIVEPLMNLLKSLHLEVQFEAVELIKDLVHLEEVQGNILASLVRLLLPEQEEKIRKMDIFEDPTVEKLTGPLPAYVQQASSAKAIGLLIQNSVDLAEKFVQLGVTHNLLIAMGNMDFADSQRQAAITLEIIARTFPLVNDLIYEAMGETLYTTFMSDPESLYLNMDSVQADILVSNKINIPKLLEEEASKQL